MAGASRSEGLAVLRSITARRVQKRLLAIEEWREECALGLAPVAAYAAIYLNDARQFKTAPPATANVLEARLRVTHRLAREGLALFAMIPAERVPLTVMSAEGLDAEIAALTNNISE